MRRYYQILGLSPSATPEQIREAYLFSLKAFHPDKFAGSSLQQQRIAHERTKAINEAYGVLSDPIKRADYDREYMRQSSSDSPPRSSSSPPPPPPPRPPPPPPPSPNATAQWSSSTEPKSPTGLSRFLADYLSVHGRIDRLTFIVRVALIFGAIVLLVLIGTANSDAQAVFGIALIVGMVLIAIQAGKRLHDINSSAGWIFAGVTGLGALALSLILPFAPGTKGSNRYGSQTIPSRSTKIGAAIIFTVALIGAIAAMVNESNKSQTTSARTNSSGMKFGNISPTPSRLTSPGLQLNTPKFDLTQPSSPQTRSVQGSDISYSVSVPNDWIVKRKQDLSKEQKDFDLIASYKTLQIGVIAEEANLGDVDTVVDFSRKLLTQKGTDARISSVERTSIDGRIWRAFTAHTTVNKIPFGYQFYVYTGPEGTFQLVGWTFENLFNRESPEIRRVLESFKFPPSTNNAATSVLPPEETTASGAGADDQIFDLPTLAKNARPAVLLLIGFDDKGKIIKSGSGFFVSRTGRLVTNWHVLEGVTSVAAKTEGGAVYKVAGVLAYSINLDLAVLKVEAQQVPFLSLERSGAPEAGTRIAVIGSPLALEGTLSEGIVSAVRKEADGTWIQMTAPVSPGSSGSPVLNQHGLVVGIATLNSTGRYQNLNFARSANDLSILMGTIQRGAVAQPFGQLPSWLARESPSPNQSMSDAPNHPVVVTIAASDDKGLNVRADHTAKSAVVATLHHGDQVSLENESFRNNDPPEPVVWQKVTAPNGATGWIRADYLSKSDKPSPADTKKVIPGSPLRLVNCRIISLERGALLDVRAGPGNNYPVLFQLSFHQNDLIRAGDGYDQRYINGETIWRAVYTPEQAFIGWAEERFLGLDY